MNKNILRINKKLIIFVFLALATLSLLTGITYAYFSSTIQDKKEVVTSITEDGEVAEVSSFETLYYATVNDIFNDSKKTSTDRKILRLISDITLANDITIDKDVHIDLNGYTLTTNNYTLTIRHSYAGCFMIYNGKLKFGENGRIVINTTNAEYLTQNVTYLDKDGNSIEDGTNYIKIVAIDEMYTAYSAFYAISSALINDIYKRPEFLTYEEFLAESLTTFDESLFLPSTGIYIFKDVELLNHYLSNDITISYTSSNSAILSSSGNVNTTGDVTLQVTLSSTAFTNDYTCNFTLHVVESTSLDAAEAMIKSNISDLYKDETLAVSSTITHEGYYFFTMGRSLPLKSNDASVTYSYKTFADKACTTEITTTSTENGDVLDFEPEGNCYYLQITITNTNKETKTLVLNMYSIHVAKHETVARLVLNDLYGGSLIYNKSEGATKLYTYDEIVANATDRVKSAIEEYGLTGVSYAITEGTTAETDYKIENNTLDILVESPASMKENSASITFTFSDNSTTTVEVYITYITSSEDTANNFLPYYTEYDNKVSEDPSLETFKMPLSYNDTAPYTVYDFSYTGNYAAEKDESTSTTTYRNLVLSKPDSLNVKLCKEDGTVIKDFTSSYTNGTSITSAFDSYLGATTISSFISTYPGAYWEFSFDSTKVSIDDIETVLIYNYKFGDTSSSDWTAYQKIEETENSGTSVTSRVYTDLTTSLFTINGGLIYSTDTSKENSVRNESLFIYLYNKLNIDNETITSASGKVILNDWFNFNIEVDTSEIPLTGDIDINGLQYLSSCTALYLSEITMTEAKITLISNLSDVEVLDISSASITDGTMLSSLKNMSSLKELYINGNSIQSFDFLTDFTSLSEVYLYSNTVTTNSDYYGSEGMCNYQTYEDLLRKGVTVYYTLNTSNVAMAYENNTDLNDYQRLKSIEYQDVLKSGVSITILYEKFESLSYSDFLLENFTSLSWSYGGGTDATDATYFMVTATNSSGIELVVKYYIDRY